LEAFYRSETQRKVYKLHQDAEGKVMLFWVSVWKDSLGNFCHGRGGDAMDSWERGEEVCRIMALPATEADYIAALKDYFAIDKKIREAFIQKYNL
jgi:hypothetical protein